MKEPPEKIPVSYGLIERAGVGAYIRDSGGEFRGKLGEQMDLFRGDRRESKGRSNGLLGKKKELRDKSISSGEALLD